VAGYLKNICLPRVTVMQMQARIRELEEALQLLGGGLRGKKSVHERAADSWIEKGDREFADAGWPEKVDASTAGQAAKQIEIRQGEAMGKATAAPE